LGIGRLSPLPSKEFPGSYPASGRRRVRKWRRHAFAHCRMALRAVPYCYQHPAGLRLSSHIDLEAGLRDLRKAVPRGPTGLRARPFRSRCRTGSAMRRTNCCSRKSPSRARTRPRERRPTNARDARLSVNSATAALARISGPGAPMASRFISTIVPELIHGTVEFQPVRAWRARAQRVHRGLGEGPLQSQVALWQCQSPCRGRDA
jgi:hypothetical protein